MSSYLLTPKEAGKLLRLSVPTLERMRLNGTGPVYIKLGTGRGAKIAYQVAELEKWIENNRFQSTSQYGRS